MSTEANPITEEEQYRRGALVVGPETDSQEELERAKAGLPSLASDPVYDPHDGLPGRPLGAESYGPLTRGALGLGGYVNDEDGGVRWVAPRKSNEGAREDPTLVTDADEALKVWGAYSNAKGETRVGVEGLDKAGPMEGYSHETQVVILVTTTHGFAAAYGPLDRAYKKGLPLDPIETVVVNRFFHRLQARLPYRTLKRTGAHCGADLPKVVVPPARYDV